MNAKIEETPMTKEEKFFGVATTIEDDVVSPVDDKSPAPEVIIEEDDDQTPVIAKEPEQKPAKKDTTSHDDELADVSERVQKRINKLTYDMHEERRQREAAQEHGREAVRAAQVLAQQNQQYQNVIRDGEAHLVEEIRGRAEMGVSAAKRAYKEAYEAGDTDAILAAQENLMMAGFEYKETADYVNGYYHRQQNVQHHPAPQQPAQQQRPQPRRPVPPSERAKEWAKQNPWFGDSTKKDMTSLTYGIHEQLVKNEGITPDTEEYFERIDQGVRKRFPEYFEDGNGVARASSTSSSAPTVVASGGRNNGAKPRQVKLNATQAKVARELGISYEQYAAEVIKGQL